MTGEPWCPDPESLDRRVPPYPIDEPDDWTPDDDEDDE